MAERKFVIHPELGLAEVVEEHKKVELGQLKDDVEVKRAELEAVQQRISEVNAELEDLQTEESTKELALDESKSYLERGEELVGEPTDGVDAGTVDSSESLSDESEEPIFGATESASPMAINY